jgi:hypothetical protein
MWKNFYTYLILGFATAWTIPSPWFGKFMAHLHSLKSDEWYLLIETIYPMILITWYNLITTPQRTRLSFVGGALVYVF